MSTDVSEAVLFLVELELARLKQLPCDDLPLMLSTCRDGLILIFMGVGAADGLKRLNLLRVFEGALRSMRCEALVEYFEQTRAGKESIEDYVLCFQSGWNGRKGVLN